MHQINPKKLLYSKWTAVQPKNKEKHFMVSEVDFDEDGALIHCLIEAVMSNNSYEIDWRSLKESKVWKQGWQ